MNMVEGINTILLPDVGSKSENEQILMELISTDFANQFDFIFISTGENLGVFQMKGFLEKQVSYREKIYGSTFDSGVLFSTKILNSRKEEIMSTCQKGLFNGRRGESWLVSCLKKIDDPMISVQPLLPSVWG